MNRSETYNRARLDDGSLSMEKVTELVRSWQSTHGLDADGMYGPHTDAAVEAALAPAPIVGQLASRGRWEPWDGPLGTLPRTRADVYDVFGDPGRTHVDRRWKKRNIIWVKDIPGVNAMPMHRLIEPYVREAFRRAFLSDPLFCVIPKPGLRAWAWTFRHQRHDPSRPLSMHAWCAIDLAPSLNKSHRFKRGETPKAWSTKWVTRWPKGLSEPVVRAFQSVGFAWGADWDEDGTSTDHTYVDPMHMELRDRSFGGHDVSDPRAIEPS